MPNILAIETSAQNCSLALLFEESIASCHHSIERQQTGLLLPSIQQLFTEVGAELNTLDGIAFSAGPGSFTGIRLAASVAQGLAFGLGIPVLAISSLQVWAQGAYLDLQAQKVLVAINAYTEEIYWGVYQLDEAGFMQAVIPDQRCKPEVARATAAGPWIGVGEGWELYSKILHWQVPDVQRVYASRSPRAVEMLALAQDQLIHNGLSPEQALPAYLYPSECWKK